MQAVMRRKLGLFGHVCRMKNNRKIKDVMTRMLEGTGRRGRPSCREWMDDITDWCQTDMHRLSLLAQDRDTWKMIIKNALDTYSIRALCPWIMMMILLKCMIQFNSTHR